MRAFTHKQFVEAYNESILRQKFFEADEYYHVYRSRYEVTLRTMSRLPIEGTRRVVEIGGGQMALLSQSLFGDECTVWDLYSDLSDPFGEKGIGFGQFDLLHDPEAPSTELHDVAVLCEVIEHLPIPAHIALKKLYGVIKPGGYLVVTTPNIHRIRNIVRLFLGWDIFGDWYLPNRGRSLGHVTEFSAGRLRWQGEQAGFEVISVDQVQVTFRGSTWGATVGKVLCLPLSLRPVWRDGLIMVCQRPINAREG